MKIELANIVTGEKSLLKGFKVLGLLPFYLTYINVKTHVRLCKIKAQIQALTKNPPTPQDFYDVGIQEKLQPLIVEYCTTALLNDREFSFFIRFFLVRKLNKCGHSHIWNLFFTIQKFDEPAFFLSYWNALLKVDNTLIKEE